MAAAAAPAMEAGLLLAELLRRHVLTLAFVASRRMAELMYVSVRDELRTTDPCHGCLRRPTRPVPYEAP